MKIKSFSLQVVDVISPVCYMYIIALVIWIYLLRQYRKEQQNISEDEDHIYEAKNLTWSIPREIHHGIFCASKISDIDETDFMSIFFWKQNKNNLRNDQPILNNSLIARVHRDLACQYSCIVRWEIIRRFLIIGDF